VIKISKGRPSGEHRDGSRASFTLAGLFDDPIRATRDRQGAEIIGQLSYAPSWGAKFVVPIPEVRIIP
jgi:hypothetical protein